MGRSSLVLDATKYGGIEFDAAAHGSFIEQEQFSSGRQDSAHQVRFGQLILNGKELHEQPEFVALKPYEDRSDLYREWAAHEYLNSLFDRQIGYINLGVHNDSDGVESIVSQYDHGVISFDSTFWADESAPAAALRPATLQRHAGLASESLGLMHGARMTHGDAQIKNLAADRQGPRAIDLESAEILDAERFDDPTSIAQTRRDLTVFIDSMGRVEENRQKIIEALSPEKVADRIVKSYMRGVKVGRASLGGEYVPNFEAQNEDVIRSELQSLVS